MKNKILKCSIVILGLTIGLSSCERENETSLENQLNLETPEKIISFNKAVDEYNNFYNTRIAPFEGKSNLDDTRAVWFDIKALENHLEKIEIISQERGIEVTSLGFIFGSDDNNKRTIIIAPMSIHPETNIEMPFSIDNNKVIFLDNNAFDKYSDLTIVDSLTDTEKSLVLNTNGYISVAKAIEMYNNYYDTEIISISTIVENDSRISFYRKGIFENYLNYIKNQAAEHNISISGLNLVFGAYGDNPTLGKEFANHQTLFFAPTQSDSKNGNNVSYSLNGNEKVEINFNLKTLERIDSKNNNYEASSFANELAGSPPMGK